MSRVEDLTLALLDDSLSQAEQHELKTLLAQDESARQIHLATMEIEMSLRGCGPPVDVSERVARSLGRRQTAGPAAAARRPRPAWRPWLGSAVLAAAVVLLLVGLLQRRPARESGPAAFASIAASVGDVTVGLGERIHRVTAPAELHAGERIQTAAAASARVEHSAGVVLHVGSETALRLDEDGAPAGRRELRLDRGSLDVEVAPQPAGRLIVFLTPHARATAVGTRFTLVVGETSTRIAVKEGRVVFERLQAATVSELTAGMEAVAQTALESGDRIANVAAVPSQRNTRRMLAFDFESGETPASFTHGEVTSCPGRPGNRCIMGVVILTLGSSYYVRLGDGPDQGPLVRYSPTATLAFDYWMAARTNKITIQIWNDQKQANYLFVIKDPAHDTWVHQEIRLSDFKADVPMDEGDGLRRLVIYGGRIGGETFYLDNLAVGH